jgi:hypothetical protein
MWVNYSSAVFSESRSVVSVVNHGVIFFSECKKKIHEKNTTNRWPPRPHTIHNSEPKLFAYNCINMAQMDPQQQPVHEQVQPAEPPSTAALQLPGPVDTLFGNSVLFADKVRNYISGYPQKIFADPLLPHGFLEGAEVGMFTYFVLKPIRTNATNLISRTPQICRFAKPAGVLLTLGQLFAGAQMALYAAVRKGSHVWLSTLEEFASNTPSPSLSPGSVETSMEAETHEHKSIIADTLCQDPLMISFKERMANQHKKSGSSLRDKHAESMEKDDPPSIIDWVLNADRVVTDKMVLALTACTSRSPAAPHPSAPSNPNL